MPDTDVAELNGHKPFKSLFGLALRLLFFALVMAVTSVTGIALFTDRLEKALLLESANMLAADRV